MLRVNQLCDLRKEDSQARELFAVPAELAREHGEDLVDDGLGHDEVVFAFDDPEQGRFGPTAREDEGRDEDVRVEDDPHSLRYRSRSCSDRIPFSLALRLQ